LNALSYVYIPLSQDAGNHCLNTNAPTRKKLSFKQIHIRRLKDQKPVIEDFLMTYLEDGRCSLSNNLSENSIRPVTVGRKNWLRGFL